jgi:hypothetical protein
MFEILTASLKKQQIMDEADRSGMRCLLPPNTGIVSCNPIRGMDVCVCVYSLFVLFCV